MNLYRETLDQIEGDTPFGPAEQQLLEGAHWGRVRVSATRPDTPNKTNRIRAPLIRHMMLGGCNRLRVPPSGVTVGGAFLTGLLDLEGVETPLDLFLRGCTLDTTPVLKDARLGAVILPGCHLPGLSAHRLRVSRGVIMSHEFQATGLVDLSSARIGQTVDCNGSFDGAGDTALNMNAVTIGADLFLSDGFSAKGLVNLTGATVTGQVDCTDGSFDGAGDPALDMDAVTIGADLFLRDGFSAKGSVNLTGAKVAGQIACDGGNFDGAGGKALEMSAVTIGAELFLSDGFSAKGTVNLSGATVTGQVACSGGSFDGAGRIALNMDAVTIGADLFLTDRFFAEGLVDLTRGQITGNLRLHGGQFDGGLRAEALRVGGTLYFHDLDRFSGPFDLTDAHVGRLKDDATSWAGVTPPVLDGFRYDRLSVGMDISLRLKLFAKAQEKDLPKPKIAIEDGGGSVLHWELQRGYDQYAQSFDPMPYSRLARVLDEQGHRPNAALVRDARDERLSIETFQRSLREADGSNRQALSVLVPAHFSRGFDRFVMGPLFRYGHAPARASLAVVLILLANTALYSVVYKTGQMAPTSAVVLTSSDWTDHVALTADGGLDTTVNTLAAWEGTASAKDYTTFSAPLYALDLFIPLDALGQEAAWAPSPPRGLWGTVGFWTGWLTQLSGWLITAIAAAAVAGVVGRKD